MIILQTAASDMRRALVWVALLFPAVGAGACDFLDPTDVTNPTVTEGTFLNTPNAAASWTRGVERQLAATINNVVVGTEVVSDNLFNNRTLFSKVFDIPQIDNSDFDVRNIQASVSRLRAMADQGLNSVLPSDSTSTDEQRAQLYFHRGYAHLLSAELFVGLPGEARGPVLTPAEHVSLAIADFEQTRTLSSDANRRASALLAAARANYLVGNRAAATAAAAQVKAMDPSLVRYVRFDVAGGPTNTMQFAVYDSGQDEFQPLPRLDFLFPKYYSVSAGDQSPIALLKVEEAYLIIAEAAVASSDLSAARTELIQLLDVVGARPRVAVDDRRQQRGRRGGTWIYPNSASVRVASSPGAEPRSDLVLSRGAGTVQVPTVSATSVTREMLNAAPTPAAMLKLIYLMRQEIFVLEGRRMTDLGIRYPVALEEAQTNPNVDLNSPALQAQIPAFIPLNYGLDSFTYADGENLAVINNDLNEILVENRTSTAVVPFQ